MESRKFYRVKVFDEPAIETEWAMEYRSLSVASRIFNRQVRRAIINQNYRASVLLSLVTGGSSATPLAAKCAGCAFVEVYPQYYELLETEEFEDRERLPDFEVEQTYIDKSERTG
jgi:hypothetical protein